MTNLTRLRVDARVDAMEFRIRVRELLHPGPDKPILPVQLREIDLAPPSSGPEVELRFEVGVGEYGQMHKLVANAEQNVRDVLFAHGFMGILALRTRPAVWS